MLWTEYKPVIKIGPKGALGSHEIRPIHSAPSLGQSIPTLKPSKAVTQSINMGLTLFQKKCTLFSWFFKRMKVLHFVPTKT